MNLNDLKKPFPRDKISWRVGATSKDKKSAIALAYIDARDVMERLDEVCGPANWQALYPHANGKTSCKIGIRIFDQQSLVSTGYGPEWVWKENGCGDSQVEAEKGAFSDALKRAAVLWGIGRYLYDVPNVWVEIDEYKKFKNLNDPRLSKALEAAEKGIKLANEPEPEIELRPVDDTEMELITKLLKEAKDLTELKSALDKVVLTGPRMSQKQKDTANDEYKKRLGFLSQAPLESVA